LVYDLVKWLNKITMKILYFIFLLPQLLFAQYKYGIQTNINGFITMPIISPKHYSIDISLEQIFNKKTVLKTGLYISNYKTVNQNLKPYF
jgi:hypothetical protein